MRLSELCNVVINLFIYLLLIAMFIIIIPTIIRT